MRAAGSHGYICECPNPWCKERLYMAPGDYERLARLGSVVSTECARMDRRSVLGRFNGAVAVRTGNGGRPVSA